jgi:preprotein translocase subunit SecG
MYTLAVVIHVLVCFLMIASILLQSGKGAEIGAMFGGSSQTIFGSRGPGTFLSKVTVAAAIVFMLTSLSLAILSKERTFSSTVIERSKQDSPTSPSHADGEGHESPAARTPTPPASEPAQP